MATEKMVTLEPITMLKSQFQQLQIMAKTLQMSPSEIVRWRLVDFWRKPVFDETSGRGALHRDPEEGCV